MLNLLYASLELDFNYILSTTPYYSIYDITSRSADGFEKLTNDKTPIAIIIRRYWRAKASGYTVRSFGSSTIRLTHTSKQLDVSTTAEHAKVERAEIARKISDWEFSGKFHHCHRNPLYIKCILGWINTKPSQVRSVSQLSLNLAPDAS